LDPFELRETFPDLRKNMFGIVELFVIVELMPEELRALSPG
jgi:hypothetical protein